MAGSGKYSRGLSRRFLFYLSIFFLLFLYYFVLTVLELHGQTSLFNGRRRARRRGSEVGTNRPFKQRPGISGIPSVRSGKMERSPGRRFRRFFFFFFIPPFYFSSLPPVPSGPALASEVKRKVPKPRREITREISQNEFISLCFSHIISYPHARYSSHNNIFHYRPPIRPLTVTLLNG